MRIKKLLPILLILLGIALIFSSYASIVKDEIWYFLKEKKDQKIGIDIPSGQKDSVFARFLTSTPISITPINKDFSIVIEKIGINSPVIADVSVSDSKAYNEALQQGIAHASVSDYPSTEAGNVYMFAHASVNFWELGRYATVFNLLRKMEPNDRIHVFYKGQDFVYSVVNKEIYPGWNTYPVTRSVIEPILTLQTCDPPGTTLNRLVVTAKLVEVI